MAQHSSSSSSRSFFISSVSLDESEIFGIGYQCSRWPVTLLNWALFQLVKVSIFHKEITRPRTLRKVLIWYKCRNLNTTSVSSYPANFVCRPGCAQKLLTVSWDKYDLGGKYTSGDFCLIHANLFSSKRHSNNDFRFSYIRSLRDSVAGILGEKCWITVNVLSLHKFYPNSCSETHIYSMDIHEMYLTHLFYTCAHLICFNF